MTETSKDIDYEQSTRRLFWLTLVIGMVGSVLSYGTKGRSVGLGFGLGSLASLLNLWIWHVITGRLGENETNENEQTKPRKAATTLFALRLLSLFALGYVIVDYLDVSPLAAIIGLFASSAAALVEIIYEITAGKRLSR